MKQPHAPLRRSRRTVAAMATAACGTALSAWSLPSLADVPAMLDPNLQVTTVVTAASTSRSASSSWARNDFLVLEKASGQVKRVIDGVIQPDAGARPGGQLELRARPAEHGAAPELSRRRRSSTFAGRKAAPAPTRARCQRAAAGQSRRSLHLERLDARRSTATSSCCGPARPTTLRCPATPARTTPARTATTTAACAVRAGRQALPVHGRPGPPRLAAEPAEWPVPHGPPSGRHVRRPGPRQRPPHGRDPAAQRRRHDPRRQSVLRRRRRDRRRSRRQHPEDLFLRPPQRLRHGVRPGVRLRSGRPKTPTTPTASSTASFPG